MEVRTRVPDLQLEPPVIPVPSSPSPSPPPFTIAHRNDLWSALALAVVDVDTIAMRVGRLDGSLTPLPVPNSGTQMPLVAQFPFSSR